MNLLDFEEKMDETILNRGLDYFQNGHIERIRETGENHYVIQVSGTTDYTVDVTLDPSTNEIMDTSCDCPYDWGDYCKHQAAAFYALRNELTAEVQSPKTPASKRDVGTILADLPKKELVRILLKIANENEEIEKYLLFQYAPEEDLVTSSKKLIREFINRAKRRGFIEWNRVDEALQGAEMTLARADKEIENDRPESAVLLALTVLPIVVDMLQYSDDSNGSAGYVIDESLGMIDKVSANGQLSVQQKGDIFRKVMKEALKDRYAGWLDWRIRLLGACIPLCGGTNLKKQLEKQINRLLDDVGGDSYEKERLMFLQLRLMENFDGQEQTLRFIYDHIGLTSFRERAVQHAMEKNDWREVLRLCEEGEKADSDYPGIVDKWRKYRLSAYEKLGDSENQKQLMFKFLYAGDYAYYEKLRPFYGSNEWQPVLKEILGTFEAQLPHSFAYVEILKSEKLYDKLLAYCQGHPQSIEDLYPYLVRDYSEKVSQLFAEWIGKEAAYSSNRSQYRKVCRKIKTYQKACGKGDARRLIEGFKEEYLRRPAFIDELNRIR